MTDQRNYYDYNSSVHITIEPTEKTPLLKSCQSKSSLQSANNKGEVLYILNSVTKYWDTRLFGIVVLLIGGFSIATYLLILESRIPDVSFSLDLVDREVWSRVSAPLGNTLNNTNVLHVLILHTGGSRCKETEHCVNLLRSMQETANQHQNAEIPYNFLLGDDGQTYVVRGWEHENGFHFLPKQSSLVIGFIGNYTYQSPSDKQMQSVLSLISESIRKRKLQNGYQIYGVKNLTMSHSDGDALFNEIAHLSNFDALLKVL